MKIKTDLSCHPGTNRSGIQRLQSELTIQPEGRLLVRYELTAEPDQILIPRPMPPKMSDGLWEHTCFEIFIAVQGESGYHEFNFSPSGQWAAYAFSAYRVQCRWQGIPSPDIQFARTQSGFLLDALIALTDLPSNPQHKPFRLGLSAVIETAKGDRTYWALHHPAANPDFHHPESFIHAFSVPLAIPTPGDVC